MRQTHGREEGDVEMEASSRRAYSHHNLEGQRTAPPLGPLEGMWLCQHLDFGFLASRAVKEYISVLFSLRVCGNLLLLETNIPPTKARREATRVNYWGLAVPKGSGPTTLLIRTNPA